MRIFVAQKYLPGELTNPDCSQGVGTPGSPTVESTRERGASIEDSGEAEICIELASFSVLSAFKPDLDFLEETSC